MVEQIRTVFRNDAPLDTNSAEFYKDYWTDAPEVSPASIWAKDEILKKFFPDGITASRILEIGVGGEGGLIYRLAERNTVTGVDVSDAAIRNCSRFGLNVMKANLDRERLPFETGSFDYVFALEVFEHFSNPQFALEEMTRLLKDSGTLLVSIPSTWSYHWPRFFYPGFFEKKNFTEFLMLNGFDPEVHDSWFCQCNEALAVPQEYKTWNYYWYARKLGNLHAETYLKLGNHFWQQVNESGLRVRPVEALELFRKSFEIDRNRPAQLAMTHALLYRFINNEKEEFMKFFGMLCTTEQFESENDRREYLKTYISVVLDAMRFGLKLANEEEYEQICRIAPAIAELHPFLNQIGRADLLNR